MTSASTAPASISTTITPPRVPSGFRRTICTHTSTYHGRVFGVRRAGAATADARSISDTGIEEGIREVDQQIQADDHRRDDQIDGLHDRIVELAERFEEEQADTGEPEDGLD